ncbi:ABC transporter ATP-binding protein [Bacteroidales bacterium OttesenSCG-928-J16]|nr:ABC transporter ATP-binding protein [Bacteroidales bacterium OttesenSCG-928-J16]
MNSIVVKNLTKKFGSFTAVDNISFEVEKGEVFGFLGANGAGKTTAMKMLCGLLTPTSGEAYVAGFNAFTEKKRIRENIGYMSQRFSLYEDLKVWENMELFGTIYKVKKNVLKSRIDEAIQRLNMKSYADELVGALPLGQKQKLAFATALIHEPQIVFLDEPTSGVDPIVRREFWELIYETAAKEVTVFVTTHYMDEAEYCNRVCFMSEGAVQVIGNPETLKQEMNVRNMDELFGRFTRR